MNYEHELFSYEFGSMNIRCYELKSSTMNCLPLWIRLHEYSLLWIEHYEHELSPYEFSFMNIRCYELSTMNVTLWIWFHEYSLLWIEHYELSLCTYEFGSMNIPCYELSTMNCLPMNFVGSIFAVMNWALWIWFHEYSLLWTVVLSARDQTRTFQVPIQDDDGGAGHNIVHVENMWTWGWCALGVVGLKERLESSWG